MQHRSSQYYSNISNVAVTFVASFCAVWNTIVIITKNKRAPNNNYITMKL